MNLGFPIGPVAIGGAVMAGLILLLSGLAVKQHDDIVTWRLRDKDQQAIAAQLRRDVADRDQRIIQVAGREYGDAGLTAAACADDISSSFERGVAFGRVISHAKSPTPAAAGGQPDARVVRDYSQAWAAGAFRPAAQPAAGGDLRTDHR